MADLDSTLATEATRIVGSNAAGLEQTPVQSTVSGGLHVNLRDASGNEEGIRTNPLNVNLTGVVSSLNSTASPLGANATFTGASEEVTDYSFIGIQVFADQASASLGFKPQYSADGTNWDDGDAYNIPAAAAGNGKFFTFPPQARFYRVVYSNGTVAQTMFRLQTIFHRTPIKTSSHRIDDLIDAENDAELTKAIITGKRVDGQFDTLRQSNNNELRNADILDNSGTNGTINVGTTAIAGKVGAANLVNRKQLVVTNLGNAIVYWGLSNGVTVANGTPIVKNQTAYFSTGPNTTIWLISSTGTNDVRLAELA